MNEQEKAQVSTTGATLGISTHKAELLKRLMAEVERQDREIDGLKALRDANRTFLGSLVSLTVLEGNAGLPENAPIQWGLCSNPDGTHQLVISVPEQAPAPTPAPQ